MRFPSWLRQLSTENRDRLARTAQTSVGYLRHLMTGRKTATAEMADRLERAAKHLPPDVEPLRRWDISETCRRCPWRTK